MCATDFQVIFSVAFFTPKQKLCIRIFKGTLGMWMMIDTIRFFFSICEIKYKVSKQSKSGFRETDALNPTYNSWLRMTRQPTNSIWHCIDIQIILSNVVIQITNVMESNVPRVISIYRYHLTSKGIPITKIRRSDDRLIFIQGIPIHGKTVFILRQGPGGHVEILNHFIS